MSQQNNKSELSAATRKKILLANGALYRASIVAARADIADGLQPSALAKEAFSRLSGTAKAMLLNTVRGGATNPRMLSPLLMAGFTVLTKTWMRKPLLYAGLAGAAIAAAVYLKSKFGDNNTTGDNAAE